LKLTRSVCAWAIGVNSELAHQRKEGAAPGGGSLGVSVRSISLQTEDWRNPSEVDDARDDRGDAWSEAVAAGQG
jgi:hypothetical protein